MNPGIFLLFLAFSFSLRPSLAQQTMGLFVSDSLAVQGYTLFGNEATTYLIDNCGRIVNSWQSDYPPGEAMYLLESGHLLRTAEIPGNFEAGGMGGRIERWSWEGTLEWYYEYADPGTHAHHDMAPLPNGNILFLAWEEHSAEEAERMGRIYDGEVWSETIIEIQPLGVNEAKIVWEWDLWDHLIQDHNPSLPNYGLISHHPELVDLNYIGPGESTFGNWIHLNSIDYHEALDQIAVSSRMLSEIWIIDHSTTTEEAATSSGGTYGKGGDLLYRYGNPATYQRGNASDQVFFHQHDVRWIPEGYLHEGKLMVFNNQKQARQSAVDIWTPPTDEFGHYRLDPISAYGPQHLDWSFSMPGFFSHLMSSAHLLPNGHLFICEGMSGRLFEADTAGNIHWEYINPINQFVGPSVQQEDPRFNQLFQANKYPADYPAFTNRSITPTDPVERNPIDIDCYVPQVDPRPDLPIQEWIRLIQNPIHTDLTLELAGASPSLQVEIRDIRGNILANLRPTLGLNIFSLAAYPPGVYLLIGRTKGEAFWTKKVVKLP
ncbi:MAG: aryl-sulfate sulfotransferase [Bacteroidota bacterium]